jgi:hypothetical protein
VRRRLTQWVVAGSGVALIVIACLATVRAGAETAGRAGVVVALDGSINPRRLPRDRPTPISVTLKGWIHFEEGVAPLPLTRIEISFGARGGLDTAGLPTCRRGRLRNATQSQAMARCGKALVGRGTIDAEVPLNPAEPLIAHAGVLAFNGRSGGRPAVWVHAYSAAPPVSFVLPFYLRTVDDGAYGVRMRAPVAASLGRWPRLRSFDITLGRRYRANGAARSYLSASCPLPPRLHIGYFALARATYLFSPRPSLSVPILRSCRVRE